jgi:hypothetical protein
MFTFSRDNILNAFLCVIDKIILIITKCKIIKIIKIMQNMHISRIRIKDNFLMFDYFYFSA